MNIFIKIQLPFINSNTQPQKSVFDLHFSGVSITSEFHKENLLMSNSSSLQQKIYEAEAMVNELRKQLEEERKGERMQAIAAARELIKTHALTAADLGLSGKAANKKVSGDKRNVVAPKYQDPATGKTWTGRGKSPAWLSTQLAGGRDKQDFLIQR
jgi:DNA-binding protein H-NS